jgi:RNA polymerase sigma-70 factor, ECF subfamily
VYREVPDLRSLAPRQRAVLILREVLRWKASEVAELLDASVASVNSALQRARATLETTDLDALTSLLREDATWSMPPYELWLQSHDDIRPVVPGAGDRLPWLAPDPEACERLARVQAVQTRRPGGSLEPWSLQVLEVSGGRIAGISFFLDTPSLFPLFGLPLLLEG